MKWIYHYMLSPHFIRIWGLWLSSCGAVEVLNFFFKQISHHAVIIFVILTALALITSIIDDIYQRVQHIKKIEGLSTDIGQLKENIATYNTTIDDLNETITEQNKTIKNTKSLYDDATRENTEYENTQQLLRSTIDLKNNTFQMYVFKILRIPTTTNIEIIKLLYEMDAYIGVDKELISSGLDAVKKMETERKEIAALEIENNGGNQSGTKPIQNN